MNLSEKTKQAILDLQKLYPESRSALIPALHIAQNEAGYLPQAIQQEVAALFDIDLNEVHAIVTFYDMFFEKPVGKHILHICKNISCMLHQSDALLAKACTFLQIKPGQTTEDGEFTVIASECLAACDRAPAMLVDDILIGPVEETALEKVLQEAKKSKGHPSPITVEEIYG